MPGGARLAGPDALDYGVALVDFASVRARCGLLSARAAVGVLAVTVFGSTACKDKRDRAWSVDLRQVRAHTEGAAPSDAWTRRALNGGLGASPLFEPATDDEGLAMSLEYWELPARDGSGRRDLVVELELEAPELVARQNHGEPVVATVMLEREAGAQGRLADDLELALRRAVSVLDARTRLAMAAPEQVVALLRSGDADLALLALEHIHEHDASEHAAAVAAVLEHPDARVRSAAVEALGAVGGPAQVEALIAQMRLAEPVDAQAGYRALANMGGEDAEAFLRFAAENEDEPSQRRAAAMALRSLQLPSEASGEASTSRRSHRR